MIDRIEKLQQSIKKDEEKIRLLQEGIKQKQAKIKELENTLILNDCNIIKAKGVNINALIDAIKKGDTAKIEILMQEENKNE